MNSLQPECVVVKEFSSELAGQRVGWVAVQESVDLPDTTFVHVMTATVGDEGAIYGYEPYTHGDTTIKYHSGSSTNGLSAVASMTIPVNSTMTGIDERYIHVVSANNTISDINILSSSTPGLDAAVYNSPYNTDNWADSARGIRELLKDRLTAADLMHLYPAIYYAMNMTFMHELTVPKSPDYSSADFSIPDPAMAKQTVAETAKAQEILQQLRAIVLFNDAALSIIKQPDSRPSSDLAECFRASRYYVRRAELDAVNVSESMTAPTGVLRPIGSVLTWPYMDPELPGADGFTVELNALESGDIGTVVRAIGRENKAAARRITYAAAGVSVLRLLNQQEASLLSE